MASSRNKRAFIKYGGSGNIVPMVLLVRSKRPDGDGWIEVPYDKCCGIVPLPVVLSGNRDLKAFIKYDKRGIIISSSTIIRRKRPADGQDWVEVPYNYCCQYTTTTTTTTTSSTTTTTTTLP